ncbi:PQQ-like beta-propeller repeat protein, partial [Pelagibacteraceae bacterium]|nr:PQQ-like beta-propeller repeat protein [Pelagibacteraceae bacterium]
YKKKFKGLTKDLYIIAEGNIIYVADNLGYTYAINHVNQKILWAKNFKIPFRSNIKIFKNNIILADTSNSIYFIDKLTGNIFKTLPTEEVTLKNEFINSLAIDENSLFYLNTFGSLYSISSIGKINWFLNINQYSEVDASNSFGSNPITLYKNKVIVSADKFLYVFNSIDGSRIVKSPITSIVKPLISNENIFMITKNNLLVNINLSTGNINYSLDISSEIANFLDTKKKTIYIKTLSILDNNLYIFLDNSFYVKFSPGGKILSVEKLPAKLGSYPIFINDSILYINEKNRFVIVN